MAFRSLLAAPFRSNVVDAARMHGPVGRTRSNGTVRMKEIDNGAAKPPPRSRRCSEEVKDLVLAAIAANPRGVSWGELAAGCGLSRTHLIKAVGPKLKEDGIIAQDSRGRWQIVASARTKRTPLLEEAEATLKRCVLRAPEPPDPDDMAFFREILLWTKPTIGAELARVRDALTLCRRVGRPEDRGLRGRQLRDAELTLTRRGCEIDGEIAALQAERRSLGNAVGAARRAILDGDTALQLLARANILPPFLRREYDELLEAARRSPAAVELAGIRERLEPLDDAQKIVWARNRGGVRIVLARIARRCPTHPAVSFFARHDEEGWALHRESPVLETRWREHLQSLEREAEPLRRRASELQAIVVREEGKARKVLDQYVAEMLGNDRKRLDRKSA